MPTAYKKWKADFIRSIPCQCKHHLSEPVKVLIDAVWSMPKSYSKSECEAAAIGASIQSRITTTWQKRCWTR